MSIEELRMDNRFRPVKREIRAIKRKIDMKEGWIFKKHVYTKEELLNSEHFSKIYSITQKIGDDIQNWYNAGRLSEMEEEIYYLKRNEIEEDLEDLKDEIEYRESTWWENFNTAISDFIVVVMFNLPKQLRRKLLRRMLEKTTKTITAKIRGTIKKLPLK